MPAHRDVPVLLLSTEAEVTDRIRGLRTGADEYVGKPYDAGYVVARPASCCAARHAAATGRARRVLVIDDSLDLPRGAARRCSRPTGTRC